MSNNMFLLYGLSFGHLVSVTIKTRIDTPETGLRESEVVAEIERSEEEVRVPGIGREIERGTETDAVAMIEINGVKGLEVEETVTVRNWQAVTSLRSSAEAKAETRT